MVRFALFFSSFPFSVFCCVFLSNENRIHLLNREPLLGSAESHAPTSQENAQVQRPTK